MSAVVKAHTMFVEVCGQRGWNDTRESWLARGARRVGMSVRKAKALFYHEPLKLTADEYLGIERAFEAAVVSLAAPSIMASESGLRLDQVGGAGSAPTEEASGRADNETRGRSTNPPSTGRLTEGETR